MAEHLISRQGIQDDHVYSIAIEHVQKDQPGSLRLLRACGLIQYIMDDTFKHHMELLHEPLRFDDLDVIVDKTFPMGMIISIRHSKLFSFTRTLIDTRSV